MSKSDLRLVRCELVIAKDELEILLASISAWQPGHLDHLVKYVNEHVSCAIGMLLEIEKSCTAPT